MSIVLGCSYAKVVCQSGARTISYSLPLTNLNGRQIESYEVKRIRHFLQGLDIDNPTEEISERVLGYRIYWDFSYGEYVDGNDIITMNNIMIRHQQGYTITLTPREDQPGRSFVVIPDNESVSLGINAGGYRGAHTDWHFRFVTKNLEQSLKLEIAVDPNSMVQGTIFGAGVLTGQIL